MSIIGIDQIIDNGRCVDSRLTGRQTCHTVCGWPALRTKCQCDLHALDVLTGQDRQPPGGDGSLTALLIAVSPPPHLDTFDHCAHNNYDSSTCHVRPTSSLTREYMHDGTFKPVTVIRGRVPCPRLLTPAGTCGRETCLGRPGNSGTRV